MKLRVVMEYDSKADSYAVYCPELPGCASAGETEEEALANIREAIVLYLEPSPVTISPHGKIYEVEIPA
jgi:predicted RNase H-like HicB family nuclease